MTENPDCRDWDLRLYEVQFAVNSTRHRVTQRTPFELVLAYQVTGPNNNPLNREIKDLNETLGNSVERRAVAELLDANRAQLSAQYDRKRKKAREYEVGDIVFVRGKAAATGESRKLSSKYRGPYEVKKVLGNDRYLISDIEGERQSTREYNGVASADRIKFVHKAGEYRRPATRAHPLIEFD